MMMNEVFNWFVSCNDGGNFHAYLLILQCNQSQRWAFYCGVLKCFGNMRHAVSA